MSDASGDNLTLSVALPRKRPQYLAPRKGPGRRAAGTGRVSPG